LADQNLPQPAGDVVAERRVDDRLHDLRRRIRFADPFETVVGADSHQHNVLTTSSLSHDRLTTQNLADDFSDLHGVPSECVVAAQTGNRGEALQAKILNKPA